MDEYIPYIKSKKFPHMSRENRAKQFAPFAVLEGVDEAMREVQIRCEQEYEVLLEEEGLEWAEMESEERS